MPDYPDYVERSEVLRVIGEYDYRGLTVKDVKTITDGCKKAVSELPAAEVVPTDFLERCLLLEIQKRFKLEKELNKLRRLNNSDTLSVGGTGGHSER